MSKWERTFKEHLVDVLWDQLLSTFTEEQNQLFGLIGMMEDRQGDWKNHLNEIPSEVCEKAMRKTIQFYHSA